MTSLAKKIVVVGGGNSAGYFARAVVAAGRGADLCIVAGENVLPYERPALSKAFLHKESPARLPGFHTSVGGGGERQTQEWYDANGVEVMLSTRVTAADLANKTLTTDTGAHITYDKLVVATGCSALKLPAAMGGALPGVHYVRDNADALALYDAMGSAKKAVVIGGGYIGLECAASLATWGLNPNVVLMEPHTMVGSGRETRMRHRAYTAWARYEAPAAPLTQLNHLPPACLLLSELIQEIRMFPARGRACGLPRSPPSMRRCTSPRGPSSIAPPRWSRSWRRTAKRAAWRLRAAWCSRLTSWWSALAGGACKLCMQYDSWFIQLCSMHLDIKTPQIDPPATTKYPHTQTTTCWFTPRTIS